MTGDAPGDGGIATEERTRAHLALAPRQREWGANWTIR